MPQIVQPNVEGSSPVGGGANVGAVILDQPAFDPLQVQMKVDKDLADYRAQKDAEVAAKKATIGKMLADLDFDVKGILDSDAQHFIDGKNKLIDAEAELYKYNDPNNPEYQRAYQKARRIRDEYAVDVQASVANKKMFEDFMTKADPDKINIDELNKDVAIARSISSPRARLEYMNKIQLKEKTPDLLKVFSEIKDKDFPMSVTEIVKKDPKTGQLFTEKTEEYTPQQIKNYAQLAENGANSALTKAGDDAFNKIQRDNPNLAKQLIENAAINKTTPKREFWNWYFTNANTVKKTLEGGSFSPDDQERAKAKYASKDDESGVKYIVEQLGNAKAGNPTFYNSPVTTGATDITGVISGLPTNVSRSNKLTGLPIGKYTVLQNNASGGMEAVSIPNTILSFELRGGKPFVKTDESLYAATIDKQSYLNGLPLDDKGYMPYSEDFAQRAVMANSKDPMKGLETLRSTLIEIPEGYKEKVVDVSAAAGAKQKTGVGKKTVSALDLIKKVKK